MPITKPFTSYNVTDPHYYDLGVLQTDEKLWIWRHRQKNNKGRVFGRSGSSISQTEAAKILGVSKAVYTKFEAGRRTVLSIDDVSRLHKIVVEPMDRNPPDLPELCILARRRSGYTLYRVADEIKLTRLHYLNLERIADPRVVRYWNRQGFRFPIHDYIEIENNVKTPYNTFTAVQPAAG